MPIRSASGAGINAIASVSENASSGNRGSSGTTRLGNGAIVSLVSTASQETWQSARDARSSYGTMMRGNTIVVRRRSH